MTLPITVLHCFADDATRDAVSTLLAMRKDTVIEAADAAEAIAYLVNGQRVDVILMAISRSTDVAQGFVKQVKQLYAQLPVVVITRKKGMTALTECTQIGADDYITMPLERAKVDKVLSGVVASSRKGRRSPAVDIDLPHDRKFGDYELKTVLGSGGAGMVYLAQKTVKGHRITCALKILHPVGKRNEEQNRDLLERFLREAETASQLSHPNIVKIIDYGLNEQMLTPYIAMEFVSGKPLRGYIASKERLHFLDKVKVIRQIADALQAIHGYDICHRDIKPENVLLDSNLKVKVTDFGIARLPNSELTQTLKVLGTPAYMAPEAFSSSRVDQRADLFSLGVLAYELFLDRRPFPAMAFSELRQAIQHNAPVEPIKIDPSFPVELQAVLARLLKKRAADRFASVAEFVSEFDKALARVTEAPKTDVIVLHGQSIKSPPVMARRPKTEGQLAKPDWK